MSKIDSVIIRTDSVRIDRLQEIGLSNIGVKFDVSKLVYMLDIEKLPTGWKLYNIPYNDRNGIKIVDENGNDRVSVSINYNVECYDGEELDYAGDVDKFWSVDVDLYTRYYVQKIRDVYELWDYYDYYYVAMDRKTGVIHCPENMVIREPSSSMKSYYEHIASNKVEIETWLDTNYPLHNDPAAYWEDE